VNSTDEGRKLARRYAMEPDLAPHVEEPWVESFIVELRLLGVEGARIGAALSEVESHCVESHDSAQQAFGDPAEYARSLQLPVEGGLSTRKLLRSGAPGMVQILGMLLLNPSFEAWLRGQQVEITIGHLAFLPLILLVDLAFPRYYKPMSRMAFEHPARFFVLMWLALFANVAAAVVALKVLDEAIWRGSAGWGLVVGTATLLAGVVWAIARLRADAPVKNPIISPFHNAEASPSDKATGPLGKLSGSFWLAAFAYIGLMPLLTLFLLTMTLVLYHMGAK
jgi:hypothetical protein